MLDQTTPAPNNLEAPGPTDQPGNPGQTPKPILVILHQETSTPAHVGLTLRQMGHALDIRRPRFGDPLPETLQDHDGAVIFGGPQSANDPDDYIRAEIDWINVPLKENKPFLGLCLGAQMLARFLGADVALDPNERCGIGYHPVTPVAPDINGVPWPTIVYQWHREGFDLPSGSELLVRADTTFPNQAFRYGSSTAIQFHPEITYLQVCRWSGTSPARLALPGAQDRPTQMRNHLAHAPAVRLWREAFLKSWVDAGKTTAV